MVEVWILGFLNAEMLDGMTVRLLQYTYLWGFSKAD